MAAAGVSSNSTIRNPQNNSDKEVSKLLRKIKERYEAEDTDDCDMANDGSANQRRRKSKLAGLFNFPCSWCTNTFEVKARTVQTESSVKSIGSLSGQDSEECLVGTNHWLEEDDDDYDGDDKTTDEVVGLEKPVDDVLKLLQKRSKDRLMVGITGLEGSGKTTLAKKVYHHPLLAARFNCRAWVRLPSNEGYGMEELLRGILKRLILTTAGVEVEEKEKGKETLSAPAPAVDGKEDKENETGQHGPLNEEELKEELSRKLRGTTYLIVLDDVRRKSVLDDIEPAIPNNSNGSRVLFTCRSRDVASKANQCYALSLLGRENSWDLLSKMAGDLHNHHQQPQQQALCPTCLALEQLGRQLADKCCGIPRAIVFFGDILKQQPKTEEKWRRLLKDANRIITDDNEGSKVVRVYDNCPLHLRLCFLYLGMFPEGHIISARQIIQLWMAEGFINFDEEAEGNNIYEVAAAKTEEKGEEILEELIDRSFVQALAWRTVDGGVKRCRIVSLFRDLCVRKGAEQHFFEVSTNASANPNAYASQSPTPTGRETTPRLAVYGKGFDLSLEATHSPHSRRSLHFFLSVASADADSCTPSAHNNNAAATPFTTSGLELLRVLNLGAVKLDRVPDCVGSLIHLRYLRINAPSLRFIPASICNIPNLQTLDMRETVRCAVPDGVWKVHSLRHLYLGSSHDAQLATIGLGGRNGSGSLFLEPLQKLQTLSGIEPNRVLKRLMVRAKFPNVSKLRLCSTDAGETREFLKSLDHLYHLQSLRLMNPSKLPDPHAFPGALSKMTLWRTNLDDDGVRTLEKLPNLRVLKLLENSISVTEFCCSEGGFPQLQVLHLVKLQVNRWSNGCGVMRSLRHLVIKDCDKLKLGAIPREVITKLKRRGSKIRP